MLVEDEALRDRLRKVLVPAHQLDQADSLSAAFDFVSGRKQELLILPTRFRGTSALEIMKRLDETGIGLGCLLLTSADVPLWRVAEAMDHEWLLRAGHRPVPGRPGLEQVRLASGPGGEDAALDRPPRAATQGRPQAEALSAANERRADSSPQEVFGARAPRSVCAAGS